MKKLIRGDVDNMTQKKCSPPWLVNDENFEFLNSKMTKSAYFVDNISAFSEANLLQNRGKVHKS